MTRRQIELQGGVIEYGNSEIEMPEDGHGDGTSKTPPPPKKEPKK